MCGKGGAPTTQTTSQNQNVAYTPRALEQFNQIYDRAYQAASTPYEAYGGLPVQYLVNTQQTGISNINDAQRYARPFINQGAAWAMEGGQSVSNAGRPISESDINRYLSPFQHAVTDATMANINETNAAQQQQLLGNAISRGALGGDRSAVAQAELARQQNMSNNTILASLNQSNYNTALQTALSQQQAAMQSGMQEASIGNLFANLGFQGQANDIAGGMAQLQAGGVEQQARQAEINAMYQNYLQRLAFPYQQAQFLASVGVPAAGGMGGAQTQIGNTGQTLTPPGMSWMQGIAGLGAIGGGVLSDFNQQQTAPLASNTGGRVGFARGGAPEMPWDLRPPDLMGGLPGRGGIETPKNPIQPMPMQPPSLQQPQQQNSVASLAKDMAGFKGLYDMGKAGYNKLFGPGQPLSLAPGGAESAASGASGLDAWMLDNAAGYSGVEGAGGLEAFASASPFDLGMDFFGLGSGEATAGLLGEGAGLFGEGMGLMGAAGATEAAIGATAAETALGASFWEFLPLLLLKSGGRTGFAEGGRPWPYNPEGFVDPEDPPDDGMIDVTPSGGDGSVANEPEPEPTPEPGPQPPPAPGSLGSLAGATGVATPPQSMPSPATASPAPSGMPTPPGMPGTAGVPFQGPNNPFAAGVPGPLAAPAMPSVQSPAPAPAPSQAPSLPQPQRQNPYAAAAAARRGQDLPGLAQRAMVQPEKASLLKLIKDPATRGEALINLGLRILSATPTSRSGLQEVATGALGTMADYDKFNKESVSARQKGQDMALKLLQENNRYNRMTPYQAGQLDVARQRLSIDKTVPLNLQLEDGTEIAGRYNHTRQRYEDSEGQPVSGRVRIINRGSGAESTTSRANAASASARSEIASIEKERAGRGQLATALTMQERLAIHNKYRQVNRLPPLTSLDEAEASADPAKPGSSAATAIPDPGQGKRTPGTWYIGPTGQPQQWRG